MVPNPYWERAWGKHLTLTEVDRPFLKSQDDEYKSYSANGSYDYTDVPGDDYVFALGQSDYHQVDSLTTDYVGLNFRVPPFDNQDVRQAFDLALNKQLLIDRVYNGEYIPTNHIVPEGNPGYNAQLTGPDGTQSITGNQTKAIQLLQAAQATCKASPPLVAPYRITARTSTTVRIRYPSSSRPVSTMTLLEKEVASIATQTWTQVLGLNVSIAAYNDLDDLEAVILAPTNTAQAWLIGWIADYPDPQDWLSLQFASTSLAFNIEYVNSPQLDQLMDQADADQNPIRRMSEYHTIEQAL